MAKLILIQLTHMIKFNVNGCNIANKGADMITTVLLNTVSLKQFNVANTNLNTTTAIKIISALKNINSLEILKMNNNNIDDEAVDAMVTVIVHNHLIEELNISCNKFSLNGAIRVVKALSMTNPIRILDISRNFESHGSSESIEELATDLAKCHSLQELNMSNNLLKFSNLLHVTEQLRNHPNLHTLNMSGNIMSFILECEFLVDVILSTNQLLKDVNVCGRNIRPRFTDECLFPPLNCNENSNRFVLQNLYLTRFGFVNKFVQTLNTDFIISEEKCATTGKSIVSYSIDHNGGTIYNQEHDLAIVIPSGAVLQGDSVQIQATASHFGPYKLPNGYDPISSFFNIIHSAYYKFKIPVYLIMGHYAELKNLKDIDNLCLLHACDHDPGEKDIVMKEMSNGVYFDYNIRYCVVALDHFCSFCVGKPMPIEGKFTALLYTYDKDEKYFAEVYFCPAPCDCKQVCSSYV